jgi:hypothetical protein
VVAYEVPANESNKQEKGHFVSLTLVTLSFGILKPFFRPPGILAGFLIASTTPAPSGDREERLRFGFDSS